MEQKFFLYARKSTDVEDKQVLSIEAQLAELRNFAKDNHLEIVEEFIEKQSAKFPGRPIFNAMMRRIEKGEVSGIISWHPDRLARNSIDGGKIIYLVDIGTIMSLKFPSFWFDNTPQGKFMLNMAFVQSKYYVDALSENTKRGLRQKVRRGEYPGPVPLGYLNDVRSKTVMVDRKKSLIIKKAFELYAENSSRLEDISDFLAGQGIKTRNNKHLIKDQISRMLTNPFYLGFFRYGGELHEGKHTPIISKSLFDKVQAILKDRSRARHSPKNRPQALCGLLHCETCRMMITGEKRIKRQKNGNVHEYVYYHCSKKSKTVICSEPCIREEALVKQLSSLLTSFALPNAWAQELIVLLNKDAKEASRLGMTVLEETKGAIVEIQRKLQRLLDGYLDQDIEREVYLKKKAELLGEKKSLEEKNHQFEHNQNSWVEPMRKWIKEAENLAKTAQDNDLNAKQVIAKEIFGSNLSLSNQTLEWGELKNGQHWPQKPWGELYLARQNEGKIPLSCLIVGDRGVEPLTFTMSM